MLGPLILIFSVIGAYSVRFQLFDVWMTLVFGVIGYFMRKFRFPMAPLILAVVLAQMMETSLSQSLMLSDGSLNIFFSRPISAFFMVLGIAAIIRGLWRQYKCNSLEEACDSDD